MLDDAPELAALERARLRAIVEGDTEAAKALHADDYELITPGGGALSKAEYLGAIAEGRLVYRRFEPIGPIRAHVHPEAAIVRYRVAIEVGWEDGADLTECWHTDYWERRGGRWQAVWSHATRTRPPERS